ncbi:hypothetical protein HanRHA438_Chr05g0214301 [Helianthus annuus]|nr:hypothetical protein HanRHA438_Chr05g0214301 [Helianthus annuus]
MRPLHGSRAISTHYCSRGPAVVKPITITKRSKTRHSSVNGPSLLRSITYPFKSVSCKRS